MMSRLTRPLALALILPALSGCDNLADVELLQIDTDGTVSGVLYRDLNGTAVQEPSDVPLSTARVELRAESGGVVVHSAITDQSGQFVLSEVDVGTYALGVDPDLVGDSLVVVGVSQLITVRPGADTTVAIGLSSPPVSIPEVRASPPGRRVLTDGIALNRLFFPGDGDLHISTNLGFLRITEVGSGGSPAVGDSIRVLGVTDVVNGQPLLTEASVFGLVSAVRFPLPQVVSTAEARSALGGTLDAALVEIRDATITDSFQGAGAYWVEANDGSGVVQVRLKDFLGFNSANFATGRTITVGRGLLVPSDTGTDQWVLTPRETGDVTTSP